MMVTFNDGGKLKQRDINIGSRTEGNVRTTYTYKANGALEAVIYNRNKRYQYSYDMDGKMIKIRENEEDEQEKIFKYDFNGRFVFIQ